MNREVAQLVAELVRLQERFTRLAAKIDNVRAELNSKGVNL